MGKISSLFIRLCGLVLVVLSAFFLAGCSRGESTRLVSTFYQATASVASVSQPATPEPASTALKCALTLLESNSIPNPDKEYDIIFAASSENLNLDSFGDWVSLLRIYGLDQNNLFSKNKPVFKYFTSACPITVTQQTTGDCPSVNLDDRMFYYDYIKVIPELVVGVHATGDVSDCAWQAQAPTRVLAVHLSTAGASSWKDVPTGSLPRILVHEIGHGLGLPDEYPGASGYWVVTPTLFTTQADCEEYQNNQTWGKDLSCAPLVPLSESCTYTDGKPNPSRACHLSNIPWRSEVGNDIMCKEGAAIPEFGRADWVVVQDFFSRDMGNVLVVPPDVYAPDDWEVPGLFASLPRALFAMAIHSSQIVRVQLPPPNTEQAFLTLNFSGGEWKLDQVTSTVMAAYAPTFPRRLGSWKVELKTVTGTIRLNMVEPGTAHVYQSGSFSHTTVFTAPPILINGIPAKLAIPLNSSLLPGLNRINIRDAQNVLRLAVQPSLMNGQWRFLQLGVLGLRPDKDFRLPPYEGDGNVILERLIQNQASTLRYDPINSSAQLGNTRLTFTQSDNTPFDQFEFLITPEDDGQSVSFQVRGQVYNYTLDRLRRGGLLADSGVRVTVVDRGNGSLWLNFSASRGGFSNFKVGGNAFELGDIVFTPSTP